MRRATRSARPTEASGSRAGRLARLALLLVAAALGACRSTDRDGPSVAGDGERRRVVFKYQPMWGDPAPFRERIRAFERENGVEIALEPLPNASSITRQYLVTALGGKTRDIDVFVADVVWIPEFARAGWIRDLSQDFPPEALRRDFVRGATEAVVVDGATFAVPWYIDVGILYFREDLVPRAPRTYDELARFARDARRARPELQGYVWQGRQYEGLVCNAFEAIWGHGGDTMKDGRVAIDTPEARRALGMLRAFIDDGTSPRSVTSAAEEESRRIFERGHAVFMRNWPYAWSELQKEGSNVRGKVGTAPLPTEDGSPGAGALGGWQLAISAYAAPENVEVATKLVAALTSLEANVDMAVAYARNPARAAAYDDPRLHTHAPFIAGLRDAARSARPRPVTPYYGMMSDVLQGELSAAVAGVRPPDVALARAQRLVDRIAP